MHRTLSPVLLLAVVACAPQNAEITGGSYTAFLSASTSPAVADGDIDFDAAETSYIVDCVLDPPLEGAIPICNDPNMWPPKHESWLRRDGYQAIREELAPWRGEAIITSEGDLQLSFHQRLPGGEDFRFAFVLDPRFAPKRCVAVEDGVELVDIDDSPWLDEWSKDNDGTAYEGGRLFYLNSGAYQFDPNEDTVTRWTLPQEWHAGYGAAKLASEEFSIRTARYGLPALYANFEVEEDETITVDPNDLFYATLPADSPSTAPAYIRKIDLVEDVIEETGEDLSAVLVPDYTPVMTTNQWRPIDGRAAGLDAWVGLHYNYVRFTPDSVLEIGGEARGEFQLVFGGLDSQSQIFMTGTFDVGRIKRDHWVTDNVAAAKFEENDTTLCGLSPDEIR